MTRSHCCALCLQSPEGFVRRLWSSVQVKCGHHGNGCAWTGSVADYPAHLEMCTATSNHPNPDHLEKCTETSDQVRTKDLTSELRRAKEAHRKALEEIGRLGNVNVGVEASIAYFANHVRAIQVDVRPQRHGPLVDRRLGDVNVDVSIGRVNGIQVSVRPGDFVGVVSPVSPRGELTLRIAETNVIYVDNIGLWRMVP